MANEIELKLRVQSADLPQLRALLTKMAGGTRARQAKLTSLYFDTPHLCLRQAGAALRVRRVGRRWVQTLKGGGAVQGGMHVREEQECLVTSASPDLSQLPAQALGLDWPKLAPQLVPVFSTVFQRSTWLMTDQGNSIEVALDRGWVQAGAQQEEILELELELKAGPTAALYELALALAAQVPLAPDPVSKAERGYRLFQGWLLQPSKATPPMVHKKHTVEQAFLAILWNCLEQLQRNQRGVAEQSDPEFIHQARVALRRLRSVLSLFSAAVPRAAWQPWADELRWLVDTLGAARDWSVLDDELLAPLIAFLQARQPLAYLPRRVKAERRKAQREAQAAVLSPRYGVLVLNIARWLDAAGWRATASAEQLALLENPIRPWAEHQLSRRHQQLQRRTRHLARLTDARRHRLRRTAKKLRYALEFFVTLYGNKAPRPYLAALTTLQAVLGTLNDNVNALQQATQLCAATRDPRCRAEAGILTGWSASRIKQQLKQLEKAGKEYRRQRAFWE